MTDPIASRSAASAAANLVLLSYDPLYGSLVPPEMLTPVRWFLQEMPGREGMIYSMMAPGPILSFFRWWEQTTLPGLALHQVMRRRWLRGRVMAELSFGAGRVVVLGAGFDPLAYSLAAKNPKVKFYEIDDSSVLRIKRTALERHGGVPANLSLISRTAAPLETVLAGLPDPEPGRRTLYVMEGQLMYQSEAEVRRLLESIGPNSVLLGSALAPQAGGQLALKGSGRLGRWLLRRVSEPFQWGIAPTALAEFLAPLGWLVNEIATPRDQLAIHLPDLAPHAVLPEGEYLFRAAK